MVGQTDWYTFGPAAVAFVYRCDNTASEKGTVGGGKVVGQISRPNVLTRWGGPPIIILVAIKGGDEGWRPGRKWL